LAPQKWIESVIEVKRVNDKILVLRVAEGKHVLCVVLVYAPQVVRPMKEKVEFYAPEKF